MRTFHQCRLDRLNALFGFAFGSLGWKQGSVVGNAECSGIGVALLITVTTRKRAQPILAAPLFFMTSNASSRNPPSAQLESGCIFSLAYNHQGENAIFPISEGLLRRPLRPLPRQSACNRPLPSRHRCHPFPGHRSRESTRVCCMQQAMCL